MGQKAACGGTCGEFVAKWEPDTSTWRTRQSLLLGGLETFSGRWPAEGGMRSGSCWARATSVPPISGGASGSWLATPTATANQLTPSMMKWPGCRNWLPTPTTQDAKNDGSISQQKRDCLNGVLRGPLNPVFVEWLMGWPENWTAVTAVRGSSRLGMDRFLEWRRQHSPFCGSD